MALNTSKCNHLTPLRFKGLTIAMSTMSLYVGLIHLRYVRPHNETAESYRLPDCPLSFSTFQRVITCKLDVDFLLLFV